MQLFHAHNGVFKRMRHKKSRIRFILAGASLIGKVNTEETLTLCFSQLVNLPYDVSVPDVDIE